MQRTRVRRIGSWIISALVAMLTALLQTGKAADAEKIYREDLKRHPENGWSLYGLLASLRAQGKSEEANAVAKRFRDVWRLADVTLTASRF